MDFLSEYINCLESALSDIESTKKTTLFLLESAYKERMNRSTSAAWFFTCRETYMNYSQGHLAIMYRGQIYDWEEKLYASNRPARTSGMIIARAINIYLKDEF